MPRSPRVILPHACYHFLNRGNRQSTIFHDGRDYDAFLNLMREAQARVPMPVVAACLMPNHIHLVLRPATGSDLQEWSHWLFTKHASHYHLRYKTNGHLWQGRYKAIPIQHDRHLLVVMRYVERNAFRARLIDNPEDWRWGSLRWREHGGSPIDLAESPVPLPRDWSSFVREPQSLLELAEIRSSIARQRPFGDQEWTSATAVASGNRQSLGRVGRPRKTGNGA
jgi:putative transposase